MGPSLMQILHAAVVSDEQRRSVKSDHQSEADGGSLEQRADHVRAHEQQRALVRASLLLSRQEPASRRRT
jgi:hypothetical protein